AHLLNHLQGSPWSVGYWRDAGKEVDFVVSHGTTTWAIEVKSGRSDKKSGLSAFLKKYPGTRTWMIGDSGVPLEEFLSVPPAIWFQA
ncbi:MAG TPA: DUF4143 domain-containing protein, partial [Candidatus Binatia bacterium]|nr:DUF4143 domain-containing protein [Candidatus Binatia bacterium]